MFVFHACPGTIPLSTLFVTMQFLLIPDNRTVLNVKPWHLTGLAHKHTQTHLCLILSGIAVLLRRR